MTYTWPEFGSNRNQAVVNKLHGKGGGTKPKHKPQQGPQREVSPTRNRGNQRKHPVITVEQSHHIQEVNTQQRKPHATDVAKKDTMAVYADPRVGPQPKIRQLWLSKELSSQVCHVDCVVNTGAGCNIPPYKMRMLYCGKHPTRTIKGEADWL